MVNNKFHLLLKEMGKSFGGLSFHQMHGYIVYAHVLGCLKNEVAFFKFLFIRPMMFGSNLKRREVIRCLVDVLVGCSAGICRLGKKIGSGKNLLFDETCGIFRHPIFLPSLRIPAEQPSNLSSKHLITSRLFRLLPNITGNE